MRISFVIPTRNRQQVLAETLRRIGELEEKALVSQSELIVVDNASDQPIDVPTKLQNGLRTRLIRSEENLNTSARNLAAHHAEGDWLVMLDDDSSPLEACDWGVLDEAPDETAAIGGEILLPGGPRESGGLPEVIVGCGCAVRRAIYLEVGGYDASFGYYAEEYDLCARLIGAGYRVCHSRQLRFMHRKSTIGRDFNEIIFRLTRNNAWIMQRYAPEDLRQDEIEHVLRRYRAIAEKENALDGYARAIDELDATLSGQTCSSLEPARWDRFAGRAAARETIREQITPSSRVNIIGHPNAKGRQLIEQELVTHGCQISQEQQSLVVIGTLSPGPMLDLQEQHPDAIAMWRMWVGVRTRT